MGVSSMKTPDDATFAGSPEQWLAHAQSDLNVARLARNQAEILPQHVCFHAQQAVEKALKAVFLSRKIEFPLTHDIEELLEVAVENGLRLPRELADVGTLTPYAVEARYPGGWGAISPGDVEQAIGLAEGTIGWAKGLLC